MAICSLNPPGNLAIVSKNEYILSYGARTTNRKTRTEGRRPEQPTNRARTATRAQGDGLSFVTKALPTEVEGMTSPMPGLSGIAEPVHSVFSHACAVCTLCLLLFVLSGSWQGTSESFFSPESSQEREARGRSGLKMFTAVVGRPAPNRVGRPASSRAGWLGVQLHDQRRKR